MDNSPGNTPTLTPPMWLLAGIAMLVVGVVLALSSTGTPQPKPASAPASEFSAERAMVTLEHFLGDLSPHPVGMPTNTAVRERLVAELEGMGLEVELQSTFACRDVYGTCAYVTNVMARIAGTGNGQALALVTHYDSVPAGPGAADAMTPVASLVEVARIMTQEPAPLNTTIFLFTDGEEVGLVGAQAFMDSHPWADEIGLVANFEARGTRGQSLLFETSDGNSRLIAEFAAAAPLPVTSSLLYDAYRLLPNDTDFTVFKEHGVPGVNFAFAEGVGHYHTPLDNPDMLSQGSLQHTGDNALAVVHAYANSELTELAGSEVLFIDLIPGTVLQAPASWAVPFGVACLVVWVFVGFQLVRSGVSSWGSVLMGLSAVLAGLLLAGLFAFGVTELLYRITNSWAPWNALPQVTRVAVWGAGALGILIPTALAARRVGFWGLAIPIWVLWSLLQVAVAGLLPGASVMLLIPLLVATLTLGLAGSLEPRAPTALKLTAILLTVLATGYLWIQLAVMVELAAGFLLSPANGIIFALALSGIIPLLATPRQAPGSARWVLITAAAATVVGVMFSGRAPVVTQGWPEQLNIVHFQLDGQAQWRVNPSVNRELPASIASLHNFVLGSEQEYFWISGAHFNAPAEPVERNVIGATLLSDELQADGSRLIRLRLDSEGSPFRYMLDLVGPGDLREIRLPDGQVTTTRNWVECSGADCTGTEVELLFGNGEPVMLEIFEFSSELPAGAADLQAARPATAVPAHNGDVSMLGVTLMLQPLN